MAFTALENPYVLDDKSAADLLALENEGSAPVSSVGFISKTATPERLVELMKLMHVGIASPLNA